MKKLIVCFIVCLIGMWSVGEVSYANPEEIIFKSSLIWTRDGQGDYLLDPSLRAPTEGRDEAISYELPIAVTTNGNIETITASWKFTGKVTLEVSADNGLHWTPVTNGVPLTSLFYSGNRIKWKAILGVDSDLTQVKLTYTDSRGTIASFGEPRLSGFKHRRPLDIVIPAKASGLAARQAGIQKDVDSRFRGNDSGVPLFNYQMKFQVDESLTKANFKDIRWTSGDGETILPHYLERIAGSSPNRIGIFWVKVPQIPEQGTTVYLYYDNPLAEDLSDPERVFDFYDDFDGFQLDTEKWEVSPGLGGSYELSDSKLKLDSARILSRDFAIRDGIIEVQASNDSDAWFVIKSQGQEETEQVAYASMYAGAEHCIAVGSIVKENDAKPISVGTLYNYRIITQGRKLTFERYGIATPRTEGSGLAMTEASLEASVTYKDKNGLKQGAVGLETSQDNVSYYDWLRVRKYAEVEPIISSQGQEEATNLAQFSGTTLAATGDVIARTPSVSEGDEAIYVSKVIPTGFETRIIVPTYYGLSTIDYGLSIDISADKGLHYKTDCENGAYYYASRGDFTAGTNLMFRSSLRGGTEGADEAISEIALDYAPGKITLISPNGAETLTAGGQKEISWTASEYESSYLMKLEYSTNKGNTYKLIAKETPNDGTYLWTVPVVAQFIGQKALVRISDALDEEIYDTSDSLFTIREKVEEVSVAPEPSLRGTEGAEAISAKEVDLNKLLETGKRPGTELYDLLIKLGDNHHSDPEEDASGCYKEGDVVVVRPTGHEWSETEKGSFLIIQMYLTPEEAQGLTRPKEILTGEVDDNGNSIMKTVKRRAKRIDLKTKLGLPSKGMSNRYEKLHNIRNTLKDKVLKLDVIEDKQ